jgi:hypothetical protein
MDKTMLNNLADLKVQLERTNGKVGHAFYRLEKLEELAVKTNERVSLVEKQQGKDGEELRRMMERVSFIITAIKWISAALLVVAGLWEKLPEDLRARLFGS